MVYYDVIEEGEIFIVGDTVTIIWALEHQAMKE